MTRYQVRYWFQSDSRDRTGEMVIESIDAESPAEVAARIQANLGTPTFIVTPSFGPAQKGGLVVINTPNVWYVEVIPPEPGRF